MNSFLSFYYSKFNQGKLLSWKLDEKELKKNPKVDRDNKGFRGRFQLWMPVGARRSNQGLKGVTDAVQEQSKPEKVTLMMMYSC